MHLLCDLSAPHGPLIGADVSVRTSIDPAIDWMLAGLPQMCGTAVAPALARPVGIVLTGITQRAFRIELAADGRSVQVRETREMPDDRVTTSATEFLRWAPRRSAWRSACQTAGDRHVVARVLDAIAIV